ncbi:hypothetical protein CEUSTIGMA_g3574.t1 [Chlamydomonas eustigma]|uniref:Uncharacterized protein n=1 Tax=Chlamydomonas eustigma TaxID=1157962 RepID=A0A250WZ76_9CHLO|nr:hypothetical protein CEUSTIGMA_g3574.t1 [Chlamydomonas eustigma]|eukprot:GAX76131.1 hypothetical protein CEUSTIGMA_g3574.t1 [Chlamydomonas eustigma]
MRMNNLPGVSAVASALTGITKRGSSKKSEPSLAGDLSSSTSAAHSVKSGNSSHYHTPDPSTLTPPIPTVVGPSTTSSGLNPNPGFDSDKRVSVDKVTNEVTKLAEQNAVFPEVSSTPSSAEPQQSLSFEPPCENVENALQSTSWIENPAFQPGSPSPSLAFHSALSGSPPPSSIGYPSSITTITFDPIPLLSVINTQPFTELCHSQRATLISMLHLLQRLHERGTSQGSLKWIMEDTSHSI